MTTESHRTDIHIDVALGEMLPNLHVALVSCRKIPRTQSGTSSAIVASTGPTVTTKPATTPTGNPNAKRRKFFILQSSYTSHDMHKPVYAEQAHCLIQTWRQSPQNFVPDILWYSAGSARIPWSERVRMGKFWRVEGQIFPVFRGRYLLFPQSDIGFQRMDDKPQVYGHR